MWGHLGLLKRLPPCYAPASFCFNVKSPRPSFVDYTEEPDHVSWTSQIRSVAKARVAWESFKNMLCLCDSRTSHCLWYKHFTLWKFSFRKSPSKSDQNPMITFYSSVFFFFNLFFSSMSWIFANECPDIASVLCALPTCCVLTYAFHGVSTHMWNVLSSVSSGKLAWPWQASL